METSQSLTQNIYQILTSWSVASRAKRSALQVAEGLFRHQRYALFDLARVLKAKRPSFFVFENVKGLLSHDQGRTFGTIIRTLDELGYDCQWQVLNSKNHGVPQNRERVFIIGHTRGIARPKVFPFYDSGEAIAREVASTTVDANYSKGIDNHGARTAIIQLNEPTHSNDRVYDPEGISPTLNTMQGERRQPFIRVTKDGFHHRRDDKKKALYKALTSHSRRASLML